MLPALQTTHQIGRERRKAQLKCEIQRIEADQYWKPGSSGLTRVESMEEKPKPVLSNLPILVRGAIPDAGSGAIKVKSRICRIQVPGNHILNGGAAGRPEVKLTFELEVVIEVKEPVEASGGSYIHRTAQ